MTQTNILLDLDENDEWTFSIVTNTELALKIQSGEKQFINIRSKHRTYETETCENCLEPMKIRVFCANNLLRPLESVFLKEEIKEESVVPSPQKEIVTVEPIIVPGKPAPPNRMTDRKRIMLKKHICPNCKKVFKAEVAWSAHVKGRFCYRRRMIDGKSQHMLRLESYLPPGLKLPDFKRIRAPISEKIVQSDGTTAYVYQSSPTCLLWVTNFDLMTKRCDICNDQYQWFPKMVMHRISVHFFPGTKQVCNGCQRRFENKEDRRKHSLYCLEKDTIRPNFCYECEIDFDDGIKYREHLLSKHAEERVDEDPFCQICQKRFFSKYMLRRHNAIHQKDLRNNASTTSERQNKDVAEDNEVVIVPNKESIVVVDSDDEVETTRYVVTSDGRSEHSYSGNGPRSSFDEENLFVVEGPKVKEGGDLGSTYQETLEDDQLGALTTESSLPRDTFKEIVTQLTVKKPSRTLGKLSYLPSDFVLPDLEKLEPRVSLPQEQPDGNVAYLYRQSEDSKIWITNFDMSELKCELCEETFSVINALTSHRMEFHFFPGNLSTCVGCGKDFTVREQKRLHSLYCRAKSKIDLIYCYICEERYESHVDYRQHLYAQHRSEYNKRVRKDDELQYLKKRVGKYQCGHCPKAFPERFLLRRHLIVTHFPSLASHTCTLCNPTRYFSMTHEYVKHQRVHTGLPRAAAKPTKIIMDKCPICEKVMQKNNIRDHIRSVHRPKVTTFASCETCGKVFKRENLNGHRLSHLPDEKRKHRCQFCGKGFNFSQGHREHEADHMGLKPYSCEYCGKTFARRQTLRDHVRTHTGNSYDCDYCEKKFWDHSSRRKHLKTHEVQVGRKLTYTKEEKRLKSIGLLEEK